MVHPGSYQLLGLFAEHPKKQYICVMRLVVILLSFCIFQQSVQACGERLIAAPECSKSAGDHACCMADEDHTTSSGQVPSDQDHHKGCTPFCSSNCCGILLMILFESDPFQLLPPPIPELDYPELPSFYFLEYQPTIWQPPRVKVV